MTEFKVGDVVRIASDNATKADASIGWEPSMDVTLGTEGTVTEVDEISVKIDGNWWYAPADLEMVRPAPGVLDKMYSMRTQLNAAIRELEAGNV